MTNSKFTYHETLGAPLKLWDSNRPFDTNAMIQLRNVAKLPFIFKHVAGMPDVHWGMGATIGSVIATKGAIIPAAVGVDIGCGMTACKTDLTASDLPGDLHALRTAIEAAVPHGRTDNGGDNDKGSWHILPWFVSENWEPLSERYAEIIKKHPKAKAFNIVNHIGTLGTGNHFIEICLDESDCVWVMLHSGSRGPGNRIGTYFIQAAKAEMKQYFIDGFLPDKDLAFMVEGLELFDDYIEAVHWAQDFAKINRNVMMHHVFDVLKKEFSRKIDALEYIDCRHNYIARENHFGSNVWVTRKGATRARKGDMGIIPGSMGTGSFIVEGLGNKDSFCSCSHGAGRVMSRGEARKTISPQDHAIAMNGIDARLDDGVLDESPAAYKDIGAVMDAQRDLVKIRHRLRQIINIKG